MRPLLTTSNNAKQQLIDNALQITKSVSNSKASKFISFFSTATANRRTIVNDLKSKLENKDSSLDEKLQAITDYYRDQRRSLCTSIFPKITKALATFLKIDKNAITTFLTQRDRWVCYRRAQNNPNISALAITVKHPENDPILKNLEPTNTLELKPIMTTSSS